LGRKLKQQVLFADATDKCTPIGKPDFDQASGRLMDGRPVTFRHPMKETSPRIGAKPVGHAAGRVGESISWIDLGRWSTLEIARP
jgi:hypothetical protein